MESSRHNLDNFFVVLRKSENSILRKKERRHNPFNHWKPKSINQTISSWNSDSTVLTFWHFWHLDWNLFVGDYWKWSLLYISSCECEFLLRFRQLFGQFAVFDTNFNRQQLAGYHVGYDICNWDILDVDLFHLILRNNTLYHTQVSPPLPPLGWNQPLDWSHFKKYLLLFCKLILNGSIFLAFVFESFRVTMQSFRQQEELSFMYPQFTAM